MIDWEKMPYTQEEFKNAWRQATLVNDVCRELGVPETTGTMRTIKRTAKDLDLPDKYVWTRDFSPADFTEAWSEITCPYVRSEEHTSELQSRGHLVCRLLLEQKKKK